MRASYTAILYIREYYKNNSTFSSAFVEYNGIELGVTIKVGIGRKLCKCVDLFMVSCLRKSTTKLRFTYYHVSYVVGRERFFDGYIAI